MNRYWDTAIQLLIHSYYSDYWRTLLCFFFSWELNAWSYCCLIYFVSFIAVLCHCHFNIAVLLVRNDWLRHWLLIQKCCFFSKPSLWLQVRWTEMLRAQKAGQQEDTDHKKKQSVWKLCVQLVKNHLHVFILVLINAFFLLHWNNSFSNLFGPSERDDHPPTTLLRQSQTVPSLQFHVQSGTLAPGSAMRLGNEATRYTITLVIINISLLWGFKGVA